MEENPFSSRSSGGSHGGSRFVFSWKASLVYGWVAFLVLLCLFVAWHKVTNQEAQLATQTNETIDAEEITIDNLQSVNDGLASSTKGRSLDVNGTLKVNDTLIFDPSDPPANPIRGQVYFDNTANVPMYYDGQRFVAVVSTTSTDTRTVVVQSTEVRTSTVVVTSGSSEDAITSTSNTNGSLARFGAGNTLTDSLLSENGSTVSVAGNLNIGANALQLGSGGFGLALNTTPLSANRSILLPDASGTICLQGSTSCGFVTGATTDFIRNQNAGAQAAANYWVSGTGRADAGLLGPSLDTADGGVLSLGGSASSVLVDGSLQVAVNNASVTTPSLLLSQAGTGDTTIELQDSLGGSFYLGVDHSAGGLLRIGSTVNALTTNAVDPLGPGGSQFQGVENQIIARKIVTGPTDSGSLASIAVHLGSVDTVNDDIKAALYSHDAANNRPGTLLGSTSTGMAGTVGWNTIPVSAPVSANTTYWVAVNIEGDGTGLSFNYCGCGIDSTTTYPRPFNNAWPTPHGAPNNALTDYEWSIYMNVASGSVTDNFAGAKLFSMSNTGGIVLQNSVDTSSAFQIQDASGVALMNVNSATADISMGADVTLSANKSLTISGGSTASRPSTATEGMIYYDTDTKRLLTYANGKWQADRTDAVIVAASNSSQSDRDAADFVADGNTAAPGDGDQVQINAALAAAAGKKVALLAGTYTVDSFVAVPNNTTLVGVGSGSLITIPNGFDVGISVILNQDSVTGSGVVIQNLSIDGNAANQSAGNMVGITLEGLGGGSGPAARDGAKVSNVNVVNMTSNGIALIDSAKGTITNNTMNNNGGSGISMQNTSSSSGTNNISIGNSYYGIELNGSSNNSVSGNIVRENLGSGIALRASSNTNTVNGNTSETNEGNGIILQNSSSSTVSGNTLTGNVTAGLSIQSSSTNNIVSANKIHDSGGATQNDGIFVWDADSNQITGNSITDTSATSNNYAIHIYDSTVDASYLSGNTLGSGSINDLGTATVMGGQMGALDNYAIQPGGSIELLKDTNVTGSLTVSNGLTVEGTLQVNGTTEISTNSTTALVVKDNSDVELLRADTDGLQLIVRELDVTYNLSVGGNLAFQGHLRSGGAAPATAAGAAACASPTVTVDGTDTAGMVMVTAGTGCASSGTIATITFDTVFANAPNVTLTPATSTAAGLATYVDYAQVTSSSFDIASSNQLTDATTYRWYYQVIE